VKLDWLYSFDHLALLGILFMLILVVKGLDRLRGTLDSLHDDYRKVNSLDEREESELNAQI
jgi:hypothetical protein